MILSAFAIAVLRLARIQILDHEIYASIADRQHTHSIELEPRRGRIYDRNGFLLAGNRSKLTFEVYWPSTIPELRAEIDSLVVDLGGHSVVTVPVEQWSVNQILARGVPLEVAAPVIESGLPVGVNWRVSSTRIYPMGDECAPILGRWSADFCEGLEMTMDHLLRGEAGYMTLERSAFPGVQLTALDGDRNPPSDGIDLMLTIDARFQSVVQEQLSLAVDESGAEWGAAVVMDPWSGEILAMGSHPVRSEDGFLAMNRCVSGYHESGSTFKVVTLAACLEEGVVVPSDTFDCSRGQISVADRTISDCHEFGSLTVEEIVSNSSNVGIVKMVSLLEDSVFYSYCRKLGFGSRTGIELPSESEGILRPPDQWSGLSKASIAIGQEVAVTPIQLACAYSALANGGMLVRPRLVLASADESRCWREWADLPATRALELATSSTTMEILVSSVRNGTGATAAVQGVQVAGKTGTAERLALGEDEYLSSFAGVLSADRPCLVVAIVFDCPDYDYRFGSVLAAPVFASIVQEIVAIEPSLAIGVTDAVCSLTPDLLAVCTEEEE